MESATLTRTARRFGMMAAVLGATAVGAGAFGAHALKGRLDAYGKGIWETAAHYHLIHAVALLLVALLSTAALAARLDGRALRVAGWSFLVGVTVFSGTLYALALTGAKGLGAITPIGGAALIIGWVALGFAFKPASGEG